MITTEPSIHATKKDIFSIYEAVCRARSLSPSPEINQAFSRLVEIAQKTPISVAKMLMQDSDIGRIADSLRKISSEAESLLESFWARKISESRHPHKTLLEFPYLNNYEDMVRAEINALGLAVKTPRVLFVGSGPLPLSPLILARNYGAQVDALDADTSACQESEAVIEKVGYSDTVHVLHGNILEKDTLDGYDIIILASLVGDTPAAKKRAVQHILRISPKDSAVILRDAQGLAELMYTPIPQLSIEHLPHVTRVETPSHIINDAIIIQPATMNHDREQTNEDLLNNLLKQYRQYKEATSPEDKSRISDEMTYANPTVWIMYKQQAYAGTDHEISTIGALRHHCDDHGGICAKRFHFLSSFLSSRGFDLCSEKEFPSDMALEKLFGHNAITSASEDLSFMNSWTSYEYHKKDGRVAKWENYNLSK